MSKEVKIIDIDDKLIEELSRCHPLCVKAFCASVHRRANADPEGFEHKFNDEIKKLLKSKTFVFENKKQIIIYQWILDGYKHYTNEIFESLYTLNATCNYLFPIKNESN